MSVLTLYHVAPAAAREAIREQGLRRHKPGERWPGMHYQPEGVYAFTELEGARLWRDWDDGQLIAHPGDDIWQITWHGGVHEDAHMSFHERKLGRNTAVWLPDDVPPTQLELVETRDAIELPIAA